MKLFIFLLLAGSCRLFGAQTNTPAQKLPEQKVEINSDTGHFDGNTRQMIYLGHVFVTDNVKSKLHCEQLTVDLPSDFGHPTNIVAETEVVLDVLIKGQTNHITADKAIYTYSVVTNVPNVIVTNEIVTFSGGKPSPKVESPQMIMWGDPLVLNVITKSFSGSNYKTIFKETSNSGNGTNSSPFNFLK